MQGKPGHDFFYFSKKEKNGIIILCFISITMMVAPCLYELSHKSEDYLKVENLPSSVDSSIMRNDFIEVKNDQTRQSYSKNEFENRQVRLFRFDPNTIDAEQWKELGISPKTISTIQNYLQKGGSFRKPEDLRKIWGLSEKKVNELMPYMIIHEQSKQSDVNLFERKYTPHRNEPIDINTCDSAMLEKLQGIGTKLSQRIISYRNKLGGFYEKGQLKEVFGLQDSTFQKISSKLYVDINKIHKIDINRCDKNVLKNHPYLRYKIADAIIQYRNQHGDFTTTEQLKNIILIDDSMLKKIQPYIDVNSSKN